eukprot:CAMPEP_0194398880 /NCGR_PEP_ID=MMETSP0174-20130528/126351_1 /TAXON_ID=216777 /ORGANISM="Proboscia alata, Strain PI-D3" /LENGTH=30 /DNA_ID= /DNA_START= /DNA_END= /DNA_ORIENTATION=
MKRDFVLVNSELEILALKHESRQGNKETYP